MLIGVTNLLDLNDDTVNNDLDVIYNDKLGPKLFLRRVQLRTHTHIHHTHTTTHAHTRVRVLNTRCWKRDWRPVGLSARKTCSLTERARVCASLTHAGKEIGDQ